MAYNKFTVDYPDYGVDVNLCAFSAQKMEKTQSEFDKQMICPYKVDLDRE